MRRSLPVPCSAPRSVRRASGRESRGCFRLPACSLGGALAAFTVFLAASFDCCDYDGCCPRWLKDSRCGRERGVLCMLLLATAGVVGLLGLIAAGAYIVFSGASLSSSLCDEGAHERAVFAAATLSMYALVSPLGACVVVVGCALASQWFSECLERRRSESRSDELRELREQLGRAEGELVEQRRLVRGLLHHRPGSPPQGSGEPSATEKPPQYSPASVRHRSSGASKGRRDGCCVM